MQKDEHKLFKLQKTIRFYSFITKVLGIWYFSMKSILAITSSFIPFHIKIKFLKNKQYDIRSIFGKFKR